MLRRSGDEEFSRSEDEKLAKLKAQLLERYGDEFKGGLGWAKEACPKKGGLAFKDIAEDVGLSVLDSFYRSASHFVHPTWKGIIDNGGLPSDLNGEALLAGPSEHGIWTPAMLTVRSIYGATFSFLTCRADSAWLPKLMQLSKLVEHASDQLRKIRDCRSVMRARIAMTGPFYSQIRVTLTPANPQPNNPAPTSPIRPPSHTRSAPRMSALPPAAPPPYPRANRLRTDSPPPQR